MWQSAADAGLEYSSTDRSFIHTAKRFEPFHLHGDVQRRIQDGFVGMEIRNRRATKHGCMVRKFHLNKDGNVGQARLLIQSNATCLCFP